jgi:hypothetical protein
VPAAPHQAGPPESEVRFVILTKITCHKFSSPTIMLGQPLPYVTCWEPRHFPSEFLDISTNTRKSPDKQLLHLNGMGKNCKGYVGLH